MWTQAYKSQHTLYTLEPNRGVKMIKMDYSKLYDFNQAFKRGALQVTTSALRSEMPLVYGELETTSPLAFTHYDGNKVYDLIGTGWVSLFLLSDKVITALEQDQVIGFRKYPAEVVDKKGVAIAGYHALGVTGRCGPIDHSMSSLVMKPPRVEGGIPCQVKKGLFFDSSTWDGSEIFIPKGSLAIIVTKRVKGIFDEIKTSNVEFTPLTEIEVVV